MGSCYESTIFDLRGRVGDLEESNAELRERLKALRDEYRWHEADETPAKGYKIVVNYKSWEYGEMNAVIVYDDEDFGYIGYDNVIRWMYLPE